MYYLIQRLLTRHPADHTKEGIDRYFIPDYMGNSRFEGGLIKRQLAAWRESPTPTVRCAFHVRKPIGTQQQLWYIGFKANVEAARAFAQDQVDGCKTVLEEPTYMKYIGTDNSLVRNLVGWFNLDAASPWVLLLGKDNAMMWEKALALETEIVAIKLDK